MIAARRSVRACSTTGTSMGLEHFRLSDRICFSPTSLLVRASYNVRIMDVTHLSQQLQQLSELKEESLHVEPLIQAIRQLHQDHEALRRDYESLTASSQVLLDDRQKLQARLAELEAINKRLTDMLWGRRSERRPVSPDQLLFAFGLDAEASLSAEEQAVVVAQRQADDAFDEQLLRDLAERRRKRRERQRETQEFPEHMERRETILDLPEEEKAGLKYIGDAVTERMRFENPHAYIERVVRRKYVVPNEPQRGVLSPPAPLAIVEGCRYDFSVIAAIAAQKFAFHCPTYRQQDWFSQSGWFPSRSTLNHLINLTVDTVGPLFIQMWQLLLRQPIVLTDDTRLLLLTRNSLSEEHEEVLRRRRQSGQRWNEDGAAVVDEPGSVTSYAWLYTGLDELAPYNVFHWSLAHEHAVVDAHLVDYRGVVVGDGFSGYTGIAERSGGRMGHASCNGHARREFVKAETTEPILCAQMLSLYGQLYDVEERGKTLNVAGRLALRQRDAIPSWARMGVWLEKDEVRRALPQSAFGKAVGYLRNQWVGLQKYLSDGRLPIDNSQTERTIRGLTVGRSNWKFLGHPRAAPGRLQLVSVVSSAQRHHLIVHAYLEDVLTKLADAAQRHPADLAIDCPYLLNLLPDRWAVAHPEAVRRERIEEQEQVSDIKRARRARARRIARQRARSGA
jgi:transposase